MAGLQTNEFDTLCSQSSKKRNHEPTEIEEEAALALLMLSQDNRSWHTSPATSTAMGGASSQCNSNGRTSTVDFNLNQPALLETYSDFTLYIRWNIQVLGDQHKVESHIPFKKQRLDE
ncbi:Hypothetical predicted protein [Olea europaea subsp. europaea]|uniref:Uncharacterized protein n=1 Tax=Olea europaea subsp. europaea TaxID=158383 RepID=A0A8S0STY6_OLEEU|nr:Hypothetical predicted protein [Olea europaea subsp. europaea]